MAESHEQRAHAFFDARLKGYGFGEQVAAVIRDRMAEQFAAVEREALERAAKVADERATPTGAGGYLDAAAEEAAAIATEIRSLLPSPPSQETTHG